MADMLVQRTVSPARKRNHEGDFVHEIQPIDDEQVRGIGQEIHTFPRQVSEAPSTTSSLTELTSTSINSPAPTKMTNSNVDDPNPAKRRKLTFAEREVEKAAKKREREEKEKEKAEAKARKDDEKRLKDEEKRKKEEEKEIVKRAKELEKAEKKKAEDAKKQEKEERKKAKEEAKEAEKLKKERNQLRIGSFFNRPAAASTPPLTPDELSSRGSSRRSSIASIDARDLTASKAPHPDFEKSFIPFFVHENTSIAPVNRWITAKGTKIFDNRGSNYMMERRSDVVPLAARFQKPRRLVTDSISVKTIMESSQANPDRPADLTGPINLGSIPYKFLSFREDIRPPYVGTFTKAISPNAARKMSRRPTYRGRTDTNYDYDSEAEWEPPAEDDEEIVDDEMSDDEEGDGEMEDFLDDENDLGRRRMFVSDMDPISSGLCWRGETFQSNGFVMEEYRMDVLHDSTSFPIDPFSSLHWTDEPKPTPAKLKNELHAKKEDLEGPMPPPRLPLVPVNAPNTLPAMSSPFRIKPESFDGENAISGSGHRGRPADANKPVKMIQPEYLTAFKQAVDGSDLTKAGLIEILKKQFPKCSKDAIKDTIGVIAVRVGKKEAEKRWQLTG